MDTPDPNPGASHSAVLPESFPLGARLGRLGRLVRKELYEILRDRRTIITLVLMPLLLYPLLAIAFQQFYLAHRLTGAGAIKYHIGFVSEKQYRAIDRHLRLTEDPPVKNTGKGEDPIIIEIKQLPDDAAAAVREGLVDVALIVKQVASKGRDLEVDLELIYNPTAVTSMAAADLIERRMATANRRALEGRLGVPGVRPVQLLRGQRVAMSAPGASATVKLSALIPLILILMTITGAVYPAIDLTAGERERGTLEILVAAPVPRLGLLFAKYVSVLTVAMLTALVNLVTMTLTLVFSGLGPQLFGEQGLTPLVVLQVFGLLLLFAAFFSAVLLILTSFARSFKEAQAYLIPLMLVSLAPGLVGMLPGLELGPLSMAPLVNIVLLGRDLLEGVADPLYATVVVFSTLLYALAALAAAARIFGAESVLYSEQTNWGDLFRRPAVPRATPSVTAALLCLALMVPIWYAASNGIAQASWLSLPWRINAGILLSVMMFAGLPLFSAWMSRVPVAGGFQLTAAPPLSFAGAALLGVSLWPLILQLMATLNDVFAFFDLSTEQREQILAAVRDAREEAFVWLMLSFMTQAAVEELFFRGYLFAALRATQGPLVTIGLTAALFGFFHVFAGGALGLERLLPSTLLGLVLGWVCWRTRSVVPGLIMHVFHNAMLVGVGQGDLSQAAELPAWWVLAGTCGTVVGAALIQFGSRGQAE